MNISSSAIAVKLDDKNYESWKIQVRSVLIFNDLWPYASGEEECPKPDKEAERKAWIAKDAKALALIILSVQENQLTYIKKATTSYDAWKTLEEVHSSKGPARKIMLYKQLFLMKKSSEHSMAEHVREFQNNVDRLEAVGVSIPPELLSIMLLNTLTEEYEGFCIAIESRDNLPNLENLKIKLIEEENRKKQASDQKEDLNLQNALLSKDKNRFKRNKKPELNNYKKSYTHPNSKTNRFEGTCFSCGKRGHRSAECRSKKGPNKFEEAAMTTVPYNTNVQCKSEWYLDSGASSHMCNNHDLFVHWKSKVQSTIQTAGSDVIKTRGLGSVILNVCNGHQKTTKITLNNVIYAPGLRYNLISISSVTENGFKVTFEKDCAEIKRMDGSSVLKAEKQEKLYLVKITKETSLCVKNANYEVLKWHQRFGHLNFNDVVKLQRQNLVDGLTKGLETKKVQCMVCDKGKITQLPFQNSTSKENDILDIVHSDICGPLSEKSLGGAKYFVTFIDGKSRYMVVAFLKNRSEVFEAFKNFQKQVQLETGKKIKCLRTDNAREYTSKEFNDYLEKQGIKRQFSVEYTPQQNGIAERANRTLIEMARCMLIEARLPKSLWAEALNTAVYIRNRCPSNSVENKTPFEIWSGKKPNVSYFRTFGSKVIALEKGPQRSKLDAKGKEYTFVGYSQESKAYRLWDGRKTILKKRDVRFYEKLNTENYLFLEFQPVDTANIPGIEKSIEKNKEELQILEPYDEDIIESPKDENKETYSEMGIKQCQGEILSEEDSIDLTERKSSGSEPIRGLPDDDVQGTSDEEHRSQPEQSTSQKAQRGRPAILRTGKRGRPRKGSSNKVNLVTPETMDLPRSFEEAMNSDNKHNWITAMTNELESLKKNKTWELVDRPKDRNVLTNKWVYSIKHNSDGTINKHKARLVARGCEQQSGIDYDQVYAPVARYGSLRMLFALCADYQLHLHHMDFVTAFVQGELEDLIFMEQPLCPTKNTESGKVCKLLKPLYGLKQAGRQWHKKLNSYLLRMGVKQTSDKCLYVKHTEGKILAILVYVDDLLIASNCLTLLNKTKRELSKQFQMKDLGEATKILGIDVRRELSTGKIEISQGQYIRKLLSEFKLQDANPVTTPLDISQNLMECNDLISAEEEMENKPFRELIGGLTYLSNTTRPDIAFAVNFLARFNSKPRIVHWNAAKRILRYLKGTINYSIKFEQTEKQLGCYVDADWAGDIQDRKSCSGFVIMLAGGPINWKAQKQRSVALSTMEAEYIALSEITKEIVYIRRLLKELGFQKYCEEGTVIYCDNQSAIKLSQDNIPHERSKHVDIRYHYCRDIQNRGEIIVKYVPTEKMVSDILTKGLTKSKHENCVEMLNLR